MKILLKRAYDTASPQDGFRVYVDRLWPRGLSHDTFHYDLWDKDIAPSTELREWFHQNLKDNSGTTGVWQTFEQRYLDELKSNPAFSALQKTIASHNTVTLLYSSHDKAHNNAVVLAKALSDD